MQKSSCAWEQAAVIYLVARGLPRDATGMSSNGRTADSGSVNGGSTPSIPAIMARSSSGLGRRPLKAEITSSNLVRATNDCKAPTSVGAFSYALGSCKLNRLSPRPRTTRLAQPPPRWPERNHPRHRGERAARAPSSIRLAGGFWRDTLRAAHRLKLCLRKSGHARNSHAPAQPSCKRTLSPGSDVHDDKQPELDRATRRRRPCAASSQAYRQR